MKVNLNFLLKSLVRTDWERKWMDKDGIEREPPNLVWQLDDALPKIYDSENKEGMKLILGGFSNLTDNVNCHTTSNNRRVKTSLVKALQIVEFAWDSPLTDAEIKKINQRYQFGAKLDYSPERHGTLMSGYYFNKVEGRVIIESFKDGIYVARNIVELPLKGEEAGR